MPMLTLTDEQAIQLVTQLPPDQQEKLFQYLVMQQWSAWADLSRSGQDGARMAASQRGRDWNTMTEAEREAFVDDLVHEDQ